MLSAGNTRGYSGIQHITNLLLSWKADDSIDSVVWIVEENAGPTRVLLSLINVSPVTLGEVSQRS